MKNMTRLALAFAVAAIACLAPMAHAEDEAQLVGSGIKSERYYTYLDQEGDGTLFVKDGPTNPNGKWIYVTLYQKGYTFHGEGWRSLASEETHWTAECEFSLSGGGVTVKFTGWLPIKKSSGVRGGSYSYLNDPNEFYGWDCTLN